MMEGRILVGLLCCLFVYVTAEDQNGGAVKFEVGGAKDDTNIKKLYDTMSSMPNDSESGDGSGDDDTEIYSGSGSGEPEPVTEKPTKAPTTSKTKSKTKKPKPTTTESNESSKSTVMVINEVETTMKAKTTEDYDGNDNEIINLNPEDDQTTEDQNNKVGASRAGKGKPSDEAGVDFTVGIIVGVVVGAILAILVIVFLVYRLRKKDEGSYSLDEPSSVAFIRDEKNGGGQGKEYFA